MMDLDVSDELTQEIRRKAWNELSGTERARLYAGGTFAIEAFYIRAERNEYKRLLEQVREEREASSYHLRWAIEVLEAAAPPRNEDEGHYANRALTYLYHIRESSR